MLFLLLVCDHAQFLLIVSTLKFARDDRDRALFCRSKNFLYAPILGYNADLRNSTTQPSALRGTCSIRNTFFHCFAG